MLLSSVHLLVPVLVTFYSRHHFLTPPSLYRTSTHSSTHQPTHTHTHTHIFSMAMHLASMVHGSGRERDAHDHHYQHQPQQPLQQTHYYHQQPQRSYAASHPAHFSTHIPPQHADYQYQRHPQSPPSPPVEEQKPSLPSISSLLHIADGDKPAHETGKNLHYASLSFRGTNGERSRTEPKVTVTIAIPAPLPATEAGAAARDFQYGRCEAATREPFRAAIQFYDREPPPNDPSSHAANAPGLSG